MVEQDKKIPLWKRVICAVGREIVGVEPSDEEASMIAKGGKSFTGVWGRRFSRLAHNEENFLGGWFVRTKRRK